MQKCLNLNCGWKRIYQAEVRQRINFKMKGREEWMALLVTHGMLGSPSAPQTYRGSVSGPSENMHGKRDGRKS